MTFRPRMFQDSWLTINWSHSPHQPVIPVPELILFRFCFLLGKPPKDWRKSMKTLGVLYVFFFQMFPLNPLDPQEYPAIPHHQRMAHAAREPSHRGKFESSQPWRLGVPASDITGVFNWHRGFSTSIARVKLWS